MKAHPAPSLHAAPVALGASGSCLVCELLPKAPRESRRKKGSVPVYQTHCSSSPCSQILLIPLYRYQSLQRQSQLLQRGSRDTIWSESPTSGFTESYVVLPICNFNSNCVLIRGYLAYRRGLGKDRKPSQKGYQCGFQARPVLHRNVENTSANAVSACLLRHLVIIYSIAPRPPLCLHPQFSHSWSP